MQVTIKHYVFGLFCLFLVLHTLCIITTNNEIKESPEQIVRVEPTGKNSNTLSLKNKIDEMNQLGQKDLCTLACNNPQLDLCYVRQLPSKADISKVFSALWRLYPVLDSDVDVYVSRDLDSRFNERELAAVGQWLQTTKHFHFMRDHPKHTAEVLAGMWGVSLGRYGSKIRQLLYESIMLATNDPFIFWAPRNSYGPDQGFLKQYVWPWGKISSVQHDSYACQKYPQALPFPTQRLMGPNNFVGSVAASNNTLKEECPLPCRLKDHKDWKYC